MPVHACRLRWLSAPTDQSTFNPYVVELEQNKDGPELMGRENLAQCLKATASIIRLKVGRFMKRQ